MSRVETRGNVYGKITGKGEVCANGIGNGAGDSLIIHQRGRTFGTRLRAKQGGGIKDQDGDGE